MISDEALASARADALQQVLVNGYAETVVDLVARVSLLGGLVEENRVMTDEGFVHAETALRVLNNRVNELITAVERTVQLLERAAQEVGK